MQHIDDFIDMAITTLVAAFMLIIGVYCYNVLNHVAAQPVIEKTAPTVTLSQLAPERIYTGKDCLLGLVSNDEYCPDPAKVVFTYNGNSYTVTYDQTWFNTWETNIQKAWTEFFSSAVSATVSEWTLVYNSSGVPIYWEVALS